MYPCNLILEKVVFGMRKSSLSTIFSRQDRAQQLFRAVNQFSTRLIIDSGVHLVVFGVHLVDYSVHLVDYGVHLVDSGVHLVDSGVHLVDSGAHLVDSGVHFVDSVVHSVDSVYTQLIRCTLSRFLCKLS